MLFCVVVFDQAVESFVCLGTSIEDTDVVHPVGLHVSSLVPFSHMQGTEAAEEGLFSLRRRLGASDRLLAITVIVRLIMCFVVSGIGGALTQTLGS